FVFFRSFVPFCIWHENDLADSIVELTGHGRRDLNYFTLHNASLIARANVLPINKCSYPEEFSKNLSNGLTEEHLCFDNEAYLVPETCQQAAGGPIGGKKFKFNKQFRYAYALNSFGRDCGFGRAAVGVRLSSHIDWLQSVLLPDYRKDSGSVHFLHSELEENDICRHVDGAEGLCVGATRCPKIRYDFSVNRRVVFCQTSTVVCCPYENMVNETTASGRELDECAHRIKASSGSTNEAQFETGYISEPYLVEVGWRGNGDAKAQWSCRGTLITSKAVLTSAKCLQQQSIAPSVIRLGLNEAAPVVNVEETILHPEFDVASGKNNIALIKMKDAIDQSTIAINPACLWKNQTHTPFEMIQPVIKESTLGPALAFTKFNSDCDRTFRRTLDEHELCVDVEQLPYMDTGDSGGRLQVKLLHNAKVTPFVVAVTSFGSACGQSTPGVYTKVSKYAPWIRSVIAA
ncbi:AGAP009252-PA, partial [Anopheles gambiae str. PEST]